jgi:hypothetical protein
MKLSNCMQQSKMASVDTEYEYKLIAVCYAFFFTGNLINFVSMMVKKLRSITAMILNY